MHLSIFLSFIVLKPKRIEIIFKIKDKDMVLKHIIKKRSENNLEDFLSII